MNTALTVTYSNRIKLIKDLKSQIQNEPEINMHFRNRLNNQKADILYLFLNSANGIDFNIPLILTKVETRTKGGLPKSENLHLSAEEDLVLDRLRLELL